ncbi:hypothetical protein Gohar_016440, partial [Gossypium harknessii]|nr:hypothetical protein [Gossypium harknessii]
MLFPPLLVFASIFSACCLATSTLGATLAKDEGGTLGKTWKFSVDPCGSGDESWAKFAEKDAYYVNNVTCDCSSSPCHIVRIVLEHNNFSGKLPAALGNLPKIERLFLNSNNFIGELPETFARLTTLKEFRIGDNNFTGKIPGFIFQNWTNLTDIYMIASGLSGPIPDIVSSGNLKNIIISDLNGAESQISQLSSLSNLEILILRSCNLIGELPTSLNHMSSLKTLILAGNMFTGAVPQWILDTKQIIDLSYNNFTSTGGVDDCQKSSLYGLCNMSLSSIATCSQALQGSITPSHYLYINCGGKVETIDNITYESDVYDDELSTFHRSTYWAFSGTGFFLDDSITKGSLVRENKQVASSVGPLYINARLSYSSLTYYAFCLHNATYNVSLHFAEIDFTDGKNYSSLGRRIFDVYIQ